MTFSQIELEAFLAIVRHGSLGRAAAQINRTQPTLSRLVREMEGRCGHLLFDRHAKGMTLTLAGEALLPHARQLVYDLAQASEALDTLSGLSRGTVRVGAVAAAARTILPPAIACLLAEAPDMRVEVLEGSQDQILAGLNEREIDIAIVAGLPRDPDRTLIARCRFDDEYSVFSAVNHPLLAREHIELQDVMRERWIMPARPAAPRAMFEDLVRSAADHPPRVAVETGSIGVMIATVACTRLLGWLPLPTLQADLAARSIGLISLPTLAVRREFFMYRRSSGRLSHAAEMLRVQVQAIDILR